MTKTGHLSKILFSELIYGGHLQSLGAASIVFVAAVLLRVGYSWDVLVVAYLIFYPLYLYNRFKEIDIDHSTNPKRTEHFKKYFGRIPFILVITIVLAIAGLIYFSNAGAFWFGVALLAGGFLYTTTFKKFTKFIPGFKNFYVALFFAALVPWFFVYYNHNFSSTVWIFTIFVYIKALTMQVLLDIKDKTSDSKSGLRTLVNYWTSKDVVNFIRILSVGTSILIPLVFTLVWPIFPPLFLWLIASAPFVLICLHQTKTNKYFAYILASGEFLLWALLILLGLFFKL